MDSLRHHGILGSASSAVNLSASSRTTFWAANPGSFSAVLLRLAVQRGRNGPSSAPQRKEQVIMDASVLYPRSPALWPQPKPLPELPTGAMTMSPATPSLWEGELNAHEARLRELALGGAAQAAKALQ